MKKAKKILLYLLSAASTVGMFIWSWLLWKDFFNPAIVAFGPAQSALVRLRLEIGKRAISGLILFGLWLGGVWGLFRARKADKGKVSLPQRGLGG